VSVHTVLDADVDLSIPDLKPQSTPLDQARRFGDFRKAEGHAVETAGLRFRPFWDGCLDVVNASDHFFPFLPRIPYLPVLLATRWLSSW
jgi:hypothetical protein